MGGRRPAASCDSVAAVWTLCVCVCVRARVCVCVVCVCVGGWVGGCVCFVLATLHQAEPVTIGAGRAERATSAVPVTSWVVPSFFFVPKRTPPPPLRFHSIRAPVGVALNWSKSAGTRTPHQSTPNDHLGSACCVGPSPVAPPEETSSARMQRDLKQPPNLKDSSDLRLC